jgi:hypothetical protein
MPHPYMDSFLRWLTVLWTDEGQHLTLHRAAQLVVRYHLPELADVLEQLSEQQSWRC